MERLGIHQKIPDRGAQSLPEVVQRRAEKLASYCRNYKECTIERDRYDTDAAGRLEYRKQKYKVQDPETIAADERNKLRRNNIMPILAGFESLIDAIDKTHDKGALAHTAKTLAAELPDMQTFAGQTYESMTFEEKRALAERIDRIADSFLDALSKSGLQ